MEAGRKGREVALVMQRGRRGGKLPKNGAVLHLRVSGGTPVLYTVNGSKNAEK